MKRKRPNILVFVTDQLRHDYLGYAGNPVVKTPHIDRLAQTGVACGRSYVSSPLCMPARATLFTGLPPRAHGVRTNGIPLSRHLPTFPEALRQAGYRTHSAGKLHLHCFFAPNGSDPATLSAKQYPEAQAVWNDGKATSLPTPYYGIESVDYIGGHTQGVWGEYAQWLDREHPGMRRLLRPEHALGRVVGSRVQADQCYAMAIPEELHYNRWVADRSIDFLESQAQSEQSFFLWCSFPDPHHPYAAPEPWCNLYHPDDVALPNRREGELDALPPFYRRVYEEGGPIVSGLFGPAKVSDGALRRLIAMTYGMISFVDNEIGRVIAALERLGLREDTVVVFLSDHGDMMGDHWMLRKGPFHFEGLVKTPLIYNWPGHFPQGRGTDGLISQLDFAPTLLDLAGVQVPEGEIPPTPEASGMLPPWPGKSVVPQLTQATTAVNESVIIENDEDYLGLRLRTLITERYKLTVYPGEDFGELFDLRADPLEQHNLWSDPKRRALKTELQLALLDRYLCQDPVLPRRLSHA